MHACTMTKLAGCFSSVAIYSLSPYVRYPSVHGLTNFAWGVGAQRMNFVSFGRRLCACAKVDVYALLGALLSGPMRLLKGEGLCYVNGRSEEQGARIGSQSRMIGRKRVARIFVTQLVVHISVNGSRVMHPTMKQFLRAR